MIQITTSQVARSLASALEMEVEDINFDLHAMLDASDEQMHLDIERYLAFWDAADAS